MTRLFQSPTEDEERLIRLFRLLSSSAQDALLTSLAYDVAEELTRPTEPGAEPQEERDDRSRDFLRETVAETQPYDDFMSSLHDHCSLDDLLTDGRVYLVIGSSHADVGQARALIGWNNTLRQDYPPLMRSQEYFPDADSHEQANEQLVDWLLGVFEDWRFRFIEALEEFARKRPYRGENQNNTD